MKKKLYKIYGVLRNFIFVDFSFSYVQETHLVMNT